MLNLPCSSSSAYLYKKTEVGKAGVRGRQNLTLMPVALLLLAGICLPLIYVLVVFPSLWGHIYIGAVYASLLLLLWYWYSCKGGSEGLNQLGVSSGLYVLDSALYLGLVEKNHVQERMSRGLIHQLI